MIVASSHRMLAFAKKMKACTLFPALLCHQTSPFSDIPSKSQDELTNYEQYLQRFNQRIRKPHERLRIQEERIIQNYINQHRHASLVAFLTKNADLTLCEKNTASKIDEELSKSWECLNEKEKLVAAYSLVKLRETKTFEAFKYPIERQIKQKGVLSIQREKLLVYLCGQLINRKSLRFLGKLQPKKLSDQLQIYSKIYEYIDHWKYRGDFMRERKCLLQYIGLLLDPNLNKKENNMLDRERSNLEEKIEPFLEVMGLQFERQVKINEFYVDYLVRWEFEGKPRETILEVSGSPHYTIGGKLKGKEVLRGVIVNEYAPLRYLHFQDFFLSKGNRNKQAHIEELLKEKTINWELKNRGTNKKWELEINEELIDTVKSK